MTGEKKRVRLNWKQACARLGCGRTKLYTLVETGDLPAYRVGLRGMWFYEDEVTEAVIRLGMGPLPEKAQTA